MSQMISKSLAFLVRQPHAKDRVFACFCKSTVRRFTLARTCKWNPQILREQQLLITPARTLWTKKPAPGNPPNNATTETQSETTSESSSVTDGKDETEQSTGIGIFRRFRDAYKEHGKVLIGVHLVTSAVWTGAFYYAAINGIDVTPLLSKLGASEKVVQYLTSSVGNLATTYVMYKIATPARYTVTIFGTYTTVRYLRKWGYMALPAKEDRIRSLVKEKYVDLKDDVKEKYVDLKDDVKDKYGDMKGEMKDKLKAKVGMDKKKS